ncbi:multidrug efflux system subunit MdtB [compost metagenome]
MLSTGVGAAGNKSIGTGAVGGMLIGTIFGIFVIPALFIVFQSLQERVSSKSPFEEGYGPQGAIEFPEVDTREH